MTHRMHPLSPTGEGQSAAAWPSYEAMNEEALRAADLALGRDVEQLAIDCGLSRRELNKQRERTPDDDQGGPASLGHQALYRAALYLDTVRRRFGAERCRPAARLVAKACGLDLAEPVAAAASDTATATAILRMGIDANRELGDFLALLDHALADNVLDRSEVQHLLDELDQVLDRTNGARNALRIRLDQPSTLSFGRKA